MNRTVLALLLITLVLVAALRTDVEARFAFHNGSFDFQFHSGRS